MIETVEYSLGPHKAHVSAFADTAQTVLRLPEVDEHFIQFLFQFFAK